MESSIAPFSRSEVAEYYRVRVPKLRQTSNRQWYCGCPVHNGKDNNFTVQSTTGLWVCYSQCGRGGGIFELEMALSGNNFREAKLSVYTIIGRDDDLPETSREDREAARADREQQQQNAFYFGEAARLMAESALEKLGQEDDERRVHTILIERLKSDPLAVYQEWQRRDSQTTAGLVYAGKKRQERLEARLWKWIGKVAQEQSA